MPILEDEDLQAAQEEEAEEEERRRQLEQEQQRERQRRSQGIDMAEDYAKRQVRQAVAKRLAPARAAATRAAATAARAAGSAIVSALGSALAAIAPYLLIIALILGVVMLIVVVLAALCNVGGTTGIVIHGVSVTLGLVGFNFCEAFQGLSGSVGTAIEGEQNCPRVPKPPGTVVGCINCADIKVVAPQVPVKTTNTNSLANQGAIAKLARLAAVNDTFWVTEAFCPAVYHFSHDHYNGYAIDVDLKPGHDGDKAKLAKLYRDVQALGVTDLLCEYPVGYLSSFGINCQAKDTTKGGHIHFIEPHH